MGQQGEGQSIGLCFGFPVRVAAGLAAQEAMNLLRHQRRRRRKVDMGYLFQGLAADFLLNSRVV
jgi:hypothetical protein